jgi:hypothetical protein
VQEVSGVGRAASAAAAIRECQRVLAASGRTLAEEAVGDAPEVGDWQHYPPGDVYDPISHAQYFYHCHPQAPPADKEAEHGHFHLFLRAAGMPHGVAPFMLPEAAIALPQPKQPVAPQAAPAQRGARDSVCHLVAIALDRSGKAVRLFTTNRWVTGETWYRADDVIGMLDRITLDAAEPSTIVSRWVAAIVRLYRPEIAKLLRERDKTVMDPRRRRRKIDMFEDPRIEVTSSQEIDLDARLAAVERLVSDQTSATHPPAPSLIPGLADGWGS